ncbi:MAG: hypothetical protein EP329_11590 [Deltaproteobacteria bacterium]|nr:MAG: hypothetical protein EP329_11590 [Deltaproteobacteria bacterium]
MSTLTRLVAALALLAVASPAAAWSPERRDPAGLKADFAAAFGIAPELVVAAEYYEIRGTPKQPGFILGRFREKPDAEWVFPGMAVYFKKKGDTKRDRFWLGRTWLGPAAKELTAIALVDLDAPKRLLDVSGQRWRSSDRPAKSLKPRWPALLLAAERQQASPTTTDLVLVSLKDPANPQVLFQQPLRTRWPEPSAEEMEREHYPPHMLLGHTLERIRFEREGKVRRLVLTERGIDSRWNPCLAPEPYDRTYVLRLGERPRYEEPPSAEPPPLPCH